MMNEMRLAGDARYHYILLYRRGQHAPCHSATVPITTNAQRQLAMLMNASAALPAVISAPRCWLQRLHILPLS